MRSHSWPVPPPVRSHSRPVLQAPCPWPPAPPGGQLLAAMTCCAVEVGGGCAAASLAAPHVCFTAGTRNPMCKDGVQAPEYISSSGTCLRVSVFHLRAPFRRGARRHWHARRRVGRRAGAHMCRSPTAARQGTEDDLDSETAPQSRSPNLFCRLASSGGPRKKFGLPADSESDSFTC